VKARSRPALALIAGLVLSAPILSATAAQAGPTCVDRHGEMLRCGAPGAMPVGWRLPADQPRDGPTAQADDPGAVKLFGLICFLGGLFALIALLPDFEGRWDGQGADEEERD
jgi:hypothetical protein